MLMPMRVFRVKPDRGRLYTVAVWVYGWRFDASTPRFNITAQASPSGLVFFCPYGSGLGGRIAFDLTRELSPPVLLELGQG